jgi:pseudouridine synthase
VAELRLQVLLARAGFGSRRACEELIRNGSVSVNGEVVTALGTKVDDTSDKVKVDGRVVARAQPLRYVALNKPREVVSTASDPQGRRTVLDLVPWVAERVYPVGRLDYHSEGLLLLTNDGELTELLTHPRHGVPKVYLAKIRGTVSQDARERLARGITLDGRRTGPILVQAVRRTSRAVKHRATTEAGPDSAGASWVEVTVHEGRYHLVREALLRFGHPVSRLKRVAFGPLELGRLQAGEARELTRAEVEALRRAATPGAKPARPRPPQGTRSGPKRRPGAAAKPARASARPTGKRGPK